MPTVAERIAAKRTRLTRAELQVAEAVLAGPQDVAFGTVHALAERAGTSAPTVVRLAAKLGLGGFSGLQGAVQSELSAALRPSELIRRRPERGDLLARATEQELSNVRTTLESVDRAAFEATVQRMTKGTIRILAGEATCGIGLLFADGLSMLRPDVRIVGGSPVRVARDLADTRRHDTLVAIDMRRYERWVLEAFGRAACGKVAITDALHSPLAVGADHVFVVSARGAGPLDSHVGTLALCDALLAGVARTLRRTAIARIDRLEEAWTSADALTDGTTSQATGRTR